jgi:hypothetical protein
VRALTPTAPAIRPAVHEIVLSDTSDLAALMKAIGTDQTPDATRCLTCVPPLTLAFEDAGGRRQATLGLPCSAESDRPALATLSIPESPRCATVTVQDLAAIRELVRQKEEKD